MRIKLRRRYRQHRLGPFRVNRNWFRPTSWGWKVGRWSWNSRRKHRVGLPGPFEAEF